MRSVPQENGRILDYYGRQCIYPILYKPRVSKLWAIADGRVVPFSLLVDEWRGSLLEESDFGSKAQH